MVVEDEWHTFSSNVDVDYDHEDNDISNVEVSHGPSPNFATYLQTRRIMHIRGIHRQPQADLVKHIWEHYNHNNNKI